MKDGQAVRTYQAVDLRGHIELSVPADIPQLSEEERDKIAAAMQAHFDKLLLRALYGG